MKNFGSTLEYKRRTSQHECKVARLRLKPPDQGPGLINTLQAELP